MTTTTQGVRAKQDAQLAKQGQQQIEYNTRASKGPVRTTPETPAEKAARLAAATHIERQAGAHNAQALAAKKTKAAPPAQAKPVGSGAAVGVAQGAMDGQPHTKLAVEQARKALYHAIKDVAGNAVPLALQDARLIVAGIQYPNASRASDARKAAAAPPKAAVTAKATQPKAAAAPKVSASRTYKAGPKPVEAKPDSWRLYMLQTIVKYTNTDAAKAAHAKSGKFVGQALDFNWSAKQGYITFA